MSTVHHHHGHQHDHPNGGTPHTHGADPQAVALNDIKTILTAILVFVVIIALCVGYEALVLFNTVREVHAVTGG